MSYLGKRYAPPQETPVLKRAKETAYYAKKALDEIGINAPCPALNFMEKVAALAMSRSVHESCPRHKGFKAGSTCISCQVGEAEMCCILINGDCFVSFTSKLIAPDFSLYGLCLECANRMAVLYRMASPLLGFIPEFSWPIITEYYNQSKQKTCFFCRLN